MEVYTNRPPPLKRAQNSNLLSGGENRDFLLGNIVTLAIHFGKRPAILVRLRPRQWTYLGEHIAIAYLNTSKLVGIAYIQLVKVRIFASDFPILFECVLSLQESMEIVPN